jgi:hypothetical protein
MPFVGIPGFVKKLSGFMDAIQALHAYCLSEGLPDFLIEKQVNLKDYRLVIVPPKGIPFRIGLKLVYRPDSEEEKTLDYIVRVNR